MVRLGDYIKITNGFAFKSSMYSESGGRVIRITNVQKGRIEDDNPKFYPKNQLSKLENYKIFKNDILMSLTGNVGRVGRFPNNLLPAYINQRVCRIKSKSKDLSDDYLFHILNSNDFENRAMNSSTGIAQMNLSTKWIEEFPIPLPPLETQKRIAQILDDAQALKQKTELLLKEYDALAQSIFLDMFGDPVTNKFNFPKGTIRELITEAKYGTSEKANEEGEYPYLRMNNLTYQGAMDYSNMKYVNVPEKNLHKYLVVKGDILFNRTNSKELVGKTAIFDKDEPMVAAGYLIRVRCNEKANSHYISAYLNSKYGKLVLMNMCKSIVGMANINAQELQSILILTPPISLQSQFAEKIALIEQQKELAKQELKESEDLFNCLLQKAFKGELI